MTYKKWAQSVIEKQPVFDSRDEAIRAAIKANKDMAIHDVYKAPDGGKYVVAAPEAFEVLYREGYKRELDAGQLVDIERGDHIDEIDES